MTEQYGRELADLFTDLVQLWERHGPEQVEYALDEMSPQVVRALLMVNIGASLT